MNRLFKFYSKPKGSGTATGKAKGKTATPAKRQTATDKVPALKASKIKAAELPLTEKTDTGEV